MGEVPRGRWSCHHTSGQSNCSHQLRIEISLTHSAQLERGSADTGLQYLSTQADPLNRMSDELEPDTTVRTNLFFLAHLAIYDSLLSAKQIAPMTAKLGGNNSKYMDTSLRHFVVPSGASSLADHLLGTFAPKSVLRISQKCRDLIYRPNSKYISRGRYHTEVAELAMVTECDPPKWRVTAKSGDVQDFDGVVLTAPIPQVP